MKRKIKQRSVRVLIAFCLLPALVHTGCDMKNTVGAQNLEAGAEAERVPFDDPVTIYTLKGNPVTAYRGKSNKPAPVQIL